MPAGSLSQFHVRALIDLAASSPELAAKWSVEAEAGITLPHDGLPDYSVAGVEARASDIKSLLDEHVRLRAAFAGAEERRNGDVLAFYLRHGLEPSWVGADGYGFRFHDYPVNHFFGAQHSLVALLAQGHRVAGLADCEDYLRRLESLPAAIDGLIESIEYRAARALRPPRRAIERVVEEIRAFSEGPAGASPLILSFRDRLERIVLAETAKARLLSSALEFVGGPVRAAFGRLGSAMKPLCANASDIPGVWQFPEGEAYYDFMLRSHTTTGWTADELHEIGRAGMGELAGEIQSHFRRLGRNTGSIAENYRELLADPRHRFDASGEGRTQALTDYRRALEVAQSGASRLFETLPRAPVEIEAIAPAYENSLVHHYSAPARDGSRPGVFHVNLRHALDGPRWEVPATTFHETVPGHHLQIALAREQPGLPFFRRVVVFGAYAEGWAKYAETLPFELGLLDDPVAELGRLRLELYSTVNLILDTGIHARRWTFAEGVAFLQREIGARDRFATDLVDRITVLPGQACAYKVGMLAIMGHRRRAQRELGAAFDLKAFHSLMLGNGSLPLTILESIVSDSLSNRSHPERLVGARREVGDAAAH